jgi:RHS repeat-associated protein
MLAAKAYDMVMGVDIHILIIPPGVPTPIPHPHIGMLFDPMDFVPVVGATVHVNNKPRGQAGSAGKNVPPHIPLGGSFTKPPGNESEVYMGSATVICDGSPMSRLGVPVLSCHDVGMPSPPRSKKKGSKPTMFLPTSVLMAIPAGQPVMVGGPPTIDMMAMATKMGMSSLGKLAGGAKKAAKKGKAAKKAKAASKNKVSKNACTSTGHPVDVAMGKVFTDGVDLELPGPVPFRWERTWYSNSDYEGPIGHGWHHSYDMALFIDRDEQVVSLRLNDGRLTNFPFLAPGEQYFDRTEKLTFIRDEKRWGFRNKQNQYHWFHPSPVDPDILQLQRIEDIDGNGIRFTYNLKGYLSSIVDSGGRKLEVLNNAKGQITEIRTGHLPENYKLINYYYDSYGDLVQVLDAADKPMIFAYQNHLLVKETNRNGLSFYFTYVGHDENAKCVHTWGDGGIYDHKLTYKEGMTEVVNSLGYRTTYIHDGSLVLQTIDANGNSSYFEYSADFNLMRETDESGLSTAYSYDERGNETAIVMPDGATYSTEYNEYDLPVVSIDAAGAITMFQYDDKNRLSLKIDPGQQITQYKYKNGLIDTIREGAAGETKFEFDKYSNLIVMQAPDGIYHWRYDGMGNVTMAADPQGNTEQLMYDKLGSIVQVNEADGNIRSQQYDAEKNMVHARDNQYDVRFVYSGMNRMHARIENNVRVDFIYDTEENLVAVKNEQGLAYNFRLDPVGEVIEEKGFDGIVRRFQRDGAGKLMKLFRQGGLVTSYQYDDGGRIAIVEHSDGSKEHFAYRPDGELIFAQNDAVTVEFEKDFNGSILKETQGLHKVSSEYNESGFRTRLTSSLGADISFERDNAGNVITSAASNGKSNWQAQFKRDTLGLEIERALPGGLKSKWERDRLGRPLRHTVSGSDGRLSDKSYRWNVNDRLQGIFNELKGAGKKFTHDEFGNLASAQYENGMQDYRMPDAVGNLFRTPGQKDRKYGPGGQLLEAEGVQYFYDAEGYLISKNVSKSASADDQIGRWEYKWFANGMLSEVMRPDGEKVSFKYDALGRRIAKTFKGNTTKWIWDNNVPLHEWVEEASATTGREEEITLKVDTEGQLVSQTAWHTKLKQPVITWLFESESFVPMAKLVGDTAYSIVADHIGVPQSMHDSEGNTVWEAGYDIYGKINELRGRLGACPFRYPGQYEDEETGLYYNRFRYYDAQTGRYISQDPMRLNGGHKLYAYVRDVNRFTDPTGLDPELHALAHKAHSKLDPESQKYKTTAVGRDSNGNLYIASSDKTVPKPQRKWAEKNGVTVVNGVGHAEETLMNSRKGIKDIDASRGVCLDCENMMKKKRVRTTTPKTGRRSKKRAGCSTV